MSGHFPSLAIPRHPLWVAAYEGACWLAAATQPAGLNAAEQAALALTARYSRPIVALPDSLDSPLAAWPTWQHYRATGDRAYLVWALPRLQQRFQTFKAERVLPGGLYRGSVDLEGMPNSPRTPGCWVDVTARQALAAESLAACGNALGNTEVAAAYRAEWRELCDCINRFCWDAALGFYVDCTEDGNHLPGPSIAGFWALIAGAATPDQAQRLTAHLTDSDSFWRVHAVPSLPANHPRYAERGALWRGSVWPLENYAIVQGLERYGYHELATRLADNHITTLSHVYKETWSHWSNYAPDYIEPGSIAQPDSAAAGVSAIALLLETILGFRPDAPAQALYWRPTLRETFSVERLPVGDAFVDVHVTAEGKDRLTATIRAGCDLHLHVTSAAGGGALLLEANQEKQIVVTV